MKQRQTILIAGALAVMLAVVTVLGLYSDLFAGGESPQRGEVVRWLRPLHDLEGHWKAPVAAYKEGSAVPAHLPMIVLRSELTYALDAYRAAGVALEDLLLAPSSMKLAPIERAKIGHKDNEVGIESWLDAQDDKGVTVRAPWRARLSYAAGVWKIEHLAVIRPDSGSLIVTSAASVDHTSL